MDAVKAFASLFRGFDKRHGRFEITGRKDSGKLEGRASTVDKEPTLADYEAHTQGRYGIGIIPLTEDNRVNFAAIDVDKYDGSINAQELARRVKDMPLVVTESKSSGVHLWLFIAGGAPAPLVIQAMKHWAGLLGFGGCEIFPKQVERSGPTDVGNWINLPYFGESRRCVLEDGRRLELSEFLDHVYGTADVPGHRVNTAWLEEHALKTEVEGERARDAAGKKAEDFDDGPPCFQAILTNGLGEGMRNICFFNFAVYFLRKYGDPDQVKRKLYALDEKHSIGLPNNEIDRIVGQAAKKEYGFQCSQSPMKDYCQRRKCRKRPFGVGNGTTADYPAEIGGMTKIMTEPPMWAFNVDGKRVLARDSNCILNQNNFRRLVMDACSKVVPVLAQDRFDQMVQSWIEHADEVEVPLDLTPVLLVLAALTEFVQERKNDQKDRIASGSVWIDEQNIAHFKASEFKNYLKAQRLDADDREVAHKLTETYALVKRNTTVSGKSMWLWSIPVKFLEVPEAAMEQPTQEIPF